MHPESCIFKTVSESLVRKTFLCVFQQIMMSEIQVEIVDHILTTAVHLPVFLVEKR